MKHLYVAVVCFGGFLLGLPVGITATEHFLVGLCKTAGYVVVKQVRMTCR
jgi:hypothetical protein